MSPLLLLLASSSLALAQDDDAPETDLALEAELQFQLGVRDFRRGDFEGALEHLLHSNRLVPNRNVVFNIARSYEELGQLENAYRQYSEFLRVETDPTRQEAARKALVRLAPQVALVSVTSDPPGAVVYVDRRNLGGRGRTPIDLALSPGEHTLIVELDGYVLAEAQVDVARGRKEDVALTLEAILGTARVQGGPEGAEIRLGEADGPLVGTIPTTLELPAGPHVLVVSSPGYQPQRQLVEIRPRQQIEAVVNLELVTGKLVVDTGLVRDALVEIDGNASGFTPSVVDVAAGEHGIRVSRPGFRTYETRVEIVADQSAKLEVQLRPLAEVTAASRTAQAVEEAPASVSLISQQEIRAFGYQELYDALLGTRGVYQGNDLTYKNLGFRGFNRSGDYGNRVLTTIDGHTLNDDQLGASYVGSDLMVDLGDVQQIEVVRGPGSALYGSNAVFGVVNVVTHDTTSPPGPHVAVSAEGRDARARAGAGFGDEDVGAWISAAGLGSPGSDYFFEELVGVRDSDGRVTDNDDEMAVTGQAKAWFGDLTLQAFYTGHQKQYPTAAFGTRPDDARAWSNDYRGFGEIRYEPQLGRAAQLYARAWVDHYRFDGQYPYGARSLYVDEWNGWWGGVEPRLVVQPVAWLGLTAGVEARSQLVAEMTGKVYDGRRDAEVVDTLLDESPMFRTISGYTMLELIGGERIRATLGGRVDRIVLPEGLEDTGFTAPSPRLSVVAKPTDRDVVKWIGGRAFRAPSPYEYFYQDGGETQIRPLSLRPETIWTAEAEWTHRPSDVVALVVGGYYNRIDALIETELVPGQDGVTWFVNTEDPTETVGVEYELRREWRGGWMASAQHSMQSTRIGGLQGGEPITNSPPHIGAIKVAAPVVPDAVTLASRVVGEAPRVTVDGGRTDWFVLWDATLSGNLPSTPLSYGLGVRNLLDWQVTYPGGLELPFPEVPQPGRTFFARLSAEL